MENNSYAYVQSGYGSDGHNKNDDDFLTYTFWQRNQGQVDRLAQ